VPAKVSVKTKVLTYTVMNFSTFFFSATAAIEGQMSLQRGLIIYVASAASINLFFWYVFRANDRAAAKAALDAVDRARKTVPAVSLAEGRIKSQGDGGAVSAKFSFNYKALCYVVANLSAPVFVAVVAIQGSLSIQTGLIIYVVSAAWINFLFWFLFRIRDKADRKAAGQVE